ncbi:cell division control protein 6 homolog [Etheostoma cragini]|uniref:cell division control protein 6 homolog n=1 Tax=Etheostoma cragini TaxID=417921 RepID=UPI00155ECBEC|nr:cell division control protein 6 homolog [Etheostoma cragini]
MATVECGKCPLIHSHCFECTIRTHVSVYVLVSPGVYLVSCPALIEAVEGDAVTLRGSLRPPVNLSPYTVDLKRPDLRDDLVHVYRHGRDDVLSQSHRYRHRTTLVHVDLVRGDVTLQISPVNLSDAGRYKVYVPKLKARCGFNLTVGDDSGCNTGAGPLGSPPKQSRPTAASPRKLGFDENSPVSARRRLVPSSPPKQPLSPPAAPSPRRHATPAGSPARQNPERKSPANKSRFLSVKQALHTAVPDRLLSRETERASIRSFLEETALRRLPGSLYVSGAPGTGKTACLNWVLQEMTAELSPVHTVVVNCMSLRSSHAVFPLLADRLKAPGGPGGLQRFLTAPGPAVLLVLDEMDQLDSKAQDVLYTVFEWPHLPKSRLCLVGIANALDLTDRILPRLQARPRCRPRLLHFPPYSRQELSAIVQDRLSQASAEGLLDASAVQFCARKVSAVSGDARKALDICRRAVEVVESDERKKASDPNADPKASRVSLPQVARVLSEVYGDRMASQGGGSDGESFPLQQKLLVCCLLLLTRSGKSKEVVLGKLHEVYSRLCAQRQVSAVGQGECLSLCGLLESRGIFSLKKAKEARLTKTVYGPSSFPRVARLPSRCEARVRVTLPHAL